MNSSGTVTAVNTSGANGLLSRRSGGASTFYTFDLQGNVAQRLSGTGGILSSDTYDAFGSRASTGGADVFGFGGQWGYQTDADTGLVLCTHRYYDPNNGRWLTRDPMGYDGGINLYGYVGNDPVDLIDPSGLQETNTPPGQMEQQECMWDIAHPNGPPWSWKPPFPRTSGPYPRPIKPPIIRPPGRPPTSPPGGGSGGGPPSWLRWIGVAAAGTIVGKAIGDGYDAARKWMKGHPIPWHLFRWHW